MNYITINQVEKALDIKFSSKDKECLVENFTEEALSDYKNDYLILPVFPMSLLELREKVEGRELFYSESCAWYDDEDFAKAKMEAKWIAIRKELPRESFSKGFDEQQRLANPGEEVCGAPQGIYAMIVNFLVNKERIFEDCYARTSTLTSDGLLVNFGDFDSGGANVNGWRPGNAGGGLGVLFARQLSFESPDSLNLGSLESLNLRISELEKFREKVEKIIRI